MRETSGKITLKHLYEIAKIKQQDPPLEYKSLKEICTMLIATARTCGIEVVKELDAKVDTTIMKLDLAQTYLQLSLHKTFIPNIYLT